MPLTITASHTVADLLTQARAAHTRFRRMAGRINERGTIVEAPRLPACSQAISEALRYRVEAEVLDPQRTDLAWREDFEAMKGQPSETLMAFYVKYLNVPNDQKAPPNDTSSQAGALTEEAPDSHGR